MRCRDCRTACIADGTRHTCPRCGRGVTLTDPGVLPQAQRYVKPELFVSRPEEMGWDQAGSVWDTLEETVPKRTPKAMAGRSCEECKAEYVPKSATQRRCPPCGLSPRRHPSKFPDGHPRKEAWRAKQSANAVEGQRERRDRERGTGVAAEATRKGWVTRRSPMERAHMDALREETKRVNAATRARAVRYFRGKAAHDKRQGRAA